MALTETNQQQVLAQLQLQSSMLLGRHSPTPAGHQPLTACWKGQQPWLLAAHGAAALHVPA